MRQAFIAVGVWLALGFSVIALDYSTRPAMGDEDSPATFTVKMWREHDGQTATHTWKNVAHVEHLPSGFVAFTVDGQPVTVRGENVVVYPTGKDNLSGFYVHRTGLF